MFKNLAKGIVNDIKSIDKEKFIYFCKKIPEGTFNYFKFKREFHGKTITSVDYIFEYIAQMPYLKIITGPLSFILYMVGFLLFIAYVYIEDYLRSLFKKKDA